MFAPPLPRKSYKNVNSKLYYYSLNSKGKYTSQLWYPVPDTRQQITIAERARLEAGTSERLERRDT